MATQPQTQPAPAGHEHDDHHELGFWSKYVFSTDHKMIGIQYGLTALSFLLFGFILMMMMRWQLAYPGQTMPVLGKILGSAFPNQMPGGVMTPDFYNSLGAMHGTIMIFLGIVPLSFGAFGNYVMPLQIGAPDMAFPKLNMLSYWLYFVGGVSMLASFFVPGGAAKSGWTSYPPLANISDIGPGFHPFFNGQTLWLLAMVILIFSSLLGSVNFITTVVQLRAPGLTWMRLPFFCWAQLITAYLLLLAFPPLQAAGVMQTMDRLAGTSFFNPDGLIVAGQAAAVSGGGSPLLWQHLFWFLAHPEVYVLILPAIGIVTEVITNNTRKPIWAYKAMVFSVVVLGFLSMFVWAHHMFLTGMGTKVSAFFQTTTVMVSVPSVIIITVLLISLWGGSIRFNTPMLFATAFIPMFGIGGLTGLPLAFNALDLHLHDTYYIIGHFHYIVAPGTIFAVFAGIYYWFPKMTGRTMSDKLGKVHFWGSLVCMNVIFFPMLIQGMAGVHRRWYDGGVTYEQIIAPVLHWNAVMSWGAWVLGLFQLIFIFNLVWSIRKGRKVGDNPWDSTTLEWQTPTPPPHGNFTRPIKVYRGPYEYSVPGSKKDFSPQADPEV
ncbi:MAG TPA: cbb3-type cytochrome c oxidase subunit I [Chthoniobacteraceae bacterium]|nr:cbb3-type cytochrome c oxidase subunit I [Chthoniobacteraceae bacterium]